MFVKSQDLRPGNIVRTAIGSNVKLVHVNVFDEAKAPLLDPNGRQAYLPGCVMVRWWEGKQERSYTFALDEKVERIFSAE